MLMIKWVYRSFQRSLVNHLKSSQEKHIPSKLSSTRYNVPWLTSTIRRMCRKKRRLYRRAKKSGKQEHMPAFKAIQNETRDALRQAHWAYVNSILVDGLERGYVSTGTSNLNSRIAKVYLHLEKADNCSQTPLPRLASWVNSSCLYSPETTPRLSTLAYQAQIFRTSVHSTYHLKESKNCSKILTREKLQALMKFQHVSSTT